MQHTRPSADVGVLSKYGSCSLFDIKLIRAFGMQSISECLGGKGRGDLMRLLGLRSVLAL